MTEETLSRRKVLKRAGVGVAAVWSVPFLASSASAGSAGVLTHRGHCTNSNGSPNCGSACPVTATCGTKNGTTCLCWIGVKNGTGTGCCECKGNISCFNSPACRKHGDCPRGWKCTFNCCQTPPLASCVPPCGQGISSLGGAGLTAAG